MTPDKNIDNFGAHDAFREAPWECVYVRARGWNDEKSCADFRNLVEAGVFHEARAVYLYVDGAAHSTPQNNCALQFFEALLEAGRSMQAPVELSVECKQKSAWPQCLERIVALFSDNALAAARVRLCMTLAQAKMLHEPLGEILGPNISRNISLGISITCKNARDVRSALDGILRLPYGQAVKHVSISYEGLSKALWDEAREAMAERNFFPYQLWHFSRENAFAHASAYALRTATLRNYAGFLCGFSDGTHAQDVRAISWKSDAARACMGEYDAAAGRILWSEIPCEEELAVRVRQGSYGAQGLELPTRLDDAAARALLQSLHFSECLSEHAPARSAWVRDESLWYNAIQ